MKEKAVSGLKEKKMDTSTASAKDADEGKSTEQAIEAAEVAKPAQNVKSITKGTLKTNSIHPSALIFATFLLEVSNFKLLYFYTYISCNGRKAK